MKRFIGLLFVIAFIVSASAAAVQAQDCPTCVQAPVFSQNLIVVKRPVRNAVANAKYGIRNNYGSCGQSTRVVMAVPVTVASYGSSGNAARNTFASNGGSGFGYFGASRKRWLGKNLGWQSPGTRRASRNPNFAIRSQVPFNTTGPTANSLVPVMSVPVVVEESNDVSFNLDTEFIKIKIKEAPEYAYNASWTWPGNSEASLRQHMASGPHWHNNPNGVSYSSLKRAHDACHNRIGPYTPAMINRSNNVGNV